MSGDDKNIGRLIAARYRLDGLLGRGGFGSVYRGWDSQIGRDVAVKLLDVTNRARSAQQTAELRERFRREAMAAGRISHPSVVTIYDFGIPDDGGEAYLVMELLEGHDLSKELRQNGPMQPDRVKSIFIPMLEALGRGHELGIVHKDIKPQNIFLCHPGTNSESLCLVDFGVARVVHEDKLTMTGLIVGTPQYMAPEYITDTLVTPALDVYQMALILVELITGAPAVPGGESFVKSCNRHFTGDLEIPEELLEGEFGKMIQLALRPLAKERLQDAQQFADMFAEIDPSTIVIDTQSTMVFMRRDSEASDTRTEPPMFPPMQPEQVSAELERLERGSDAHVHAPETPVAIEQPVATQPPVATATPAPATPTAEEPPPAMEPPPETSPQPMTAQPDRWAMWAGLAVVAVLLVGGVVIVLALTSSEDPPAAAPIDVLVEPITESPDEQERSKPVEMTRITSDPTGAQIIVDGKQVGTTPGEVALGITDAAELHLDGYEVALVKIEPDVETIELTPLPRDAPSRPATKRRAAPVEALPPTEPEEPDAAVAEAAEDPPEEVARPAKFKSTKENKRPERFDKPDVVIAP